MQVEVTKKLHIFIIIYTQLVLTQRSTLASFPYLVCNLRMAVSPEEPRSHLRYIKSEKSSIYYIHNYVVV